MTKIEKIRILLVEDDLNLGFLLLEFLETNGFSVKLYRDGESGLNAFKNDEYDFCLLDIMLPKIDGFTLAERIKSINKTMPIIIITAKSMKEDMLKGYSIGIDDYITKPFDEDELVCKINAVLMRVKSNDNIKRCVSINIGNYDFNYENQILCVNNQAKRLTVKEKEIIKMLAENKGQIVKRKDILLSIWGNDDYFTGRSLDVFITKIRKYFEKDPNIKIENIPTVGYVLTD